MQWINLPGLTKYTDALQIMEEKVNDIISLSHHEDQETIFLLEHSDIYTAGTSAKDSELLSRRNGIPVIYTGRGGKFTYHGPGQRIIYPILNLNLPNRNKDIRLYIKKLENWIISSLESLQIEAFILKDKIGIWVLENNQPAKIGAIGIRIKKWVTYHGIAVNISTNIEKYKGIIPCGISDFPVTSLERLGLKITNEEFDLILKIQFKKIFSCA